MVSSLMLFIPTFPEFRDVLNDELGVRESRTLSLIVIRVTNLQYSFFCCFVFVLCFIFLVFILFLFFLTFWEILDLLFHFLAYCFFI